MALFGNKNKQGESYLGIDIGNSALKMVELRDVNKRPTLITYGYVEQANEILRSNSKKAKDDIVRAIRDVRQQSKAQSTKVIASLPSYTVFMSIIHLPQMGKKELIEAVQWEAKKFVPMPIEEMILDWKILDDEFHTSFAANDPTGGQFVSTPDAAVAGGDTPARIKSKRQKYLKILLTAAPKDLVQRYIDIFKRADLQLVGLETESFAAERALLGKDPAPIMMIDMGAVATTISVVVDGVPVINRSIDVAGNTITKSIGKALHLDLETAEQFKRDFGMGDGTEAEQGNPQVPKQVQYLLTSVVNEIKYVLNLYQTQTSGPIEKIVLTGGSAWLPHMPQYISNYTGAKVYIGDPWSSVLYPDELRPVLHTIGPRMSVAVGLAMRQIVK